MVITLKRFGRVGALALTAQACTAPQYASPEPDRGDAEAMHSSVGDSSRHPDSTFASTSDASQAERDASVASPSAQEAGTPTLPASSDIATARALLRGDYIVRTRFYQSDGTIGQLFVAHEIVELGSVLADGDELEMQLTLCHQTAVLTAPLTVHRGAVAHPERWPVRTRRLVLDSPGTFHSEGAPLVLGYGPAPAACAAMKTAAPSLQQAWLKDRPCKCPTSEAVLPVDVEDCRIVDSDGDDLPGATIEVTGGTRRTDYVRQRNASQFVSGHVALDRKHFALYAHMEDYAVLDCEPGPCPGREVPKDCARSSTTVEFAPLPTQSLAAPWNCQQVLADLEMGKHLSSVAPSFPEGC